MGGTEAAGREKQIEDDSKDLAWAAGRREALLSPVREVRRSSGVGCRELLRCRGTREGPRPAEQPSGKGWGPGLTCSRLKSFWHWAARTPPGSLQSR